MITNPSYGVIAVGGFLLTNLLIKSCIKCKILKAHEEFHKRTRSKDGLQRWCKLCTARYKAAYHKAHPEKQRTINLRRNYALSTIDYIAMVAAQYGCCKICGVKPNRPLYVDHCHKTGVIRGLLCNGCNVHLSLLEKPDLLKKAYAYLTANRTPPQG